MNIKCVIVYRILRGQSQYYIVLELKLKPPFTTKRVFVHRRSSKFIYFNYVFK